MKTDIGRRYGILTVVERLPGSLFVCRCDCGEIRRIQVGHFNAEYYNSCGCLVARHGQARNQRRSREYTAYQNMISRCHNENNSRFSDYGGAGIEVCDRWRSSFINFFEDMGPCPPGMQIDRIDNSKGYAPGNCRWASRKQNQRNRHCSNHWVVFGRQFETAQEAAAAHGVSASTINAWCRGRKTEGRWYPPKEGCYVEPKYRGGAA